MLLSGDLGGDLEIQFEQRTELWNGGVLGTVRDRQRRSRELLH